MWRNLIICMTLALVTFLVYQPLRQAEFINFDDPGYVRDNQHVQGGLFPAPTTSNGSRFDNLVWAFAEKDKDGWGPNGSEFNWHPMTWLSYMADMDIYHRYLEWFPRQPFIRPPLAPDMPAPGGYHLTNILLHMANAALLFLVLWRLTKIRWASAVVAAIFALHPQHTESVAWVAERKDVLSGMFWILTIGAYGLYVERRDRKRWIFYGLVLLCAALGLMSKPMLVTLPFTLLLLDVWPLRRITFGGEGGELLEVDEAPPPGSAPRKGKSAKAVPQSVRAPEPTGGLPTWAWVIIEKVPLLIMAGLSIAITYHVQLKGGAMTYAIRCPLDVRVMNMPISYVTYLFKTLVPIHLAVFYPYNHDPQVWQTGGAVLLIAVITGLVVWQIRRRPYLAVGWFWFLGTLVPVIGLVQVGAQAMADRYTYIPTLGLFLAAVFGLREAVVAYRRRPAASIPVAIAAVLVAALVVAVLITSSSWLKANEAWAKTHAPAVLNLLAPAVIVFIVMVFALAVGVLWHRDRLWGLAALGAGAVLFFIPLAAIQVDYWPNTKVLFEHALEIEPRNAVAHCNLGESAFLLERYKEAEDHFLAALAIDDNQTGAHNNLGWSLARRGKIDEAIGHYKRSLEIDDKNAAAHNNYALALMQKKQIQEAIDHLNRALELEKDYSAAHNNLGMILAEQGKLTEAEAHYREAIRINRRDLAARCNLSMVLVNQGKMEAAVETLKTVMRDEPRYPNAYINLGLIYCRTRQFKEAADEFDKALQLDPNQAGVHNNIGMSLAQLGQPKEAIEHFRLALGLDSTQPDARVNLASILQRTGQVEEAISLLRAGLAQRPDWPQALSLLAGILATDPRFRKPEESLDLAAKAAALTGRQDPQILDTLAAAQAANSRFDDAIATGGEALELARRLRPELAPGIEARIELYKAGRPIWQMP
jgi:protein O-mannosyl-transferase